jgi:pimeloyl-ACP methyl ester carboxylesterase
MLDPDMLVPILEDHLTEEGSFEPTLRQVSCPVLLLQADPEFGTTTEDGHVATIRAHAPGWVVARITGAGHVIHHDQPEALLERVTRFLEGIG